MCFCLSDAINVLIHVKARKRYPGIKFHEPSLKQVAAQFGITHTDQVRAMQDSQLQALSDALLRVLPDHARPVERSAAAA